MNGAPAALFLNRAEHSRPGRFLRVGLRGKGANTAGLGARVSVVTGSVRQVRTVRTGSSYLSQSERTLTFGLGAATAVHTLEVRWPSGAVTTQRPERIDTTLPIQDP